MNARDKDTQHLEPTVIFFDLGKVLVDYDFNLAYNYIKERSALPADEFNQRIPAIEELNVVYETGEIKTIGFLQKMADTLEFDDSIYFATGFHLEPNSRIAVQVLN